MNHEETTLNHRDLYFLGVLAERSTELAMKDGKFPCSCGEAQAVALARAEYLVVTPERLADGTRGIRYEITPKG